MGHLVECRKKDQQRKKDRQHEGFKIAPDVKKGYDLSANAYKKDRNRVFTKSSKLNDSFKD